MASVGVSDKDMVLGWIEYDGWMEELLDVEKCLIFVLVTVQSFARSGG